ncbi:acetylcholine receptor subunit alpha-type des-2 [Nephila pilipes]|uniref:Acetylcholine receptor subunit alpha-type des-2 n=1 Tax=Nephila pilipes TaxID=299642 RepID=A0A8X6NVN4_NEPPI|nr:acetylcholine receptor subunit alpha-type des-2 [Nephila pilipes]
MSFEFFKVLHWCLGIAAFGFLNILFFRMQPICGQEVMDTTPISELRRLREDLLRGYDSFARPVKDVNQELGVLIYFDVKKILDLNEKYQTLTVEGILMMKWTDDYLKWDPSNYSGISMVRFTADVIWFPIIHSIFNVKERDIHGNDILSIEVSSNGSVNFNAPSVFDVPCGAKYRHYPFDSHNCSIVLGSWYYHGREVMLEALDIPLRKNSVIGTEWMLTNITHSKEAIGSDKYKYPLVRVNLYLKRISTIYRFLCVIPSLIVFISSMSGFWLLPSDATRYLIGCSNVILMSLLLQNMAISIPAGTEIPLITQYSATCLCMSGVFLVITVITELLRNCSGIPPKLVVKLAHQYLESYCCLLSFLDASADKYKALKEITSSSNSAPVAIPEEVKRKNDWVTISLVVDRMAFWIFVLVYVILLVVLTVI